MATARKAEAIALIVKRALVQARDHDHVAANPRQPAMNSDDTGVVVHVEHIDAFAAQRRMLSPEPHEVAREAMLIRHVLVLARETVPPDQQFRPPRPVRPVFVLQKFLPHENHRDPRRRQEKTRGDLGPTARVPGTCVAGISERGDAGLTVSAGVIEVEQVVVLDALEDGPARGVFVSHVKGIAQLVEIDSGVAAASGLSDQVAQRVSQRVTVARIEAHSVRRDGSAFPTVPGVVVPVFGDLHGFRLDVAQRVREVLGELPAAAFRDHRDLIVTKPVDVILLQQRLAIVDHELPHLLS